MRIRQDNENQQVEETIQYRDNQEDVMMNRESSLLEFDKREKYTSLMKKTAMPTWPGCITTSDAKTSVILCTTNEDKY